MGIADILLLKTDHPNNPLAGLLYIPVQKTSKLLVISHGFGCSKQDMASLAQKICDQGYFVFTPDLRGHKLGNTGGYLNSIKDVCDDLEESIIYAKKKTGANKVILAGHSMSGGASVRTGALCPDVDGIIIMAIGLRPIEEDLSRFTSLVGFIDKYVDGHPGMELSNQSQLTMQKHISLVPPKPILVIGGTQDEVNTEKRCKALLETINGPKTLVMVESDHFKVPNYSASIIIEWLDKYFSNESSSCNDEKEI